MVTMSFQLVVFKVGYWVISKLFWAILSAHQLNYRVD